MKKKTLPLSLVAIVCILQHKIKLLLNNCTKKKEKKKSIQLVQIVFEEDNVMLSFLNHDRHD